MRVLVVSWRMPWDEASSAGRKTHNYYLKRLVAEYGKDVYLISFAEVDDLPHCDLDKYGVSRKIIPVKMDFASKVIRNLMSISAKYNYDDKYGGIIQKWYLYKVMGVATELKKSGLIPDVIVLEWTQMLFAYDGLRKIFPDAKFVSSEHDVSYLSYKRKLDYASNGKRKERAQKQYQNLRVNELAVLSKMDLIFTHNLKDKELLVNDGIKQSLVDWIVPYFMPCKEHYKIFEEKRNIVFFGAMARPENYLSAIWFIENVLYKLKDEKVKFYIIGGQPAKDLEKYKSERVIMTGYVDNVYDYFQKACCLVAPLVLGGGIKIKVLEGLSFGIPVITNTIGIEGIPALNKKDYFLCETPDDYINTINGILDGNFDLGWISNNAINLVTSTFDIERSFNNYLSRIEKLLKRR